VYFVGVAILWFVACEIFHSHIRKRNNWPTPLSVAISFVQPVVLVLILLAGLIIAVTQRN